MKKYSREIVLILVILLYEYTSAFWLPLFGKWVLEIRLLYLAIFLFAIGYTIYNIVKCIKKKFKDKGRNITSLFMAIVLITITLFPVGSSLQKVMYKGVSLISYLSGVAGNTACLVLYGNGTYEFYYSWSVFIRGDYKVKNDTIYFDKLRADDVFEADYAILDNDRSGLSFKKDSIYTFSMEVVKNDLKILKE